VDGIVREPSGEIRIITENCIGCGACAERCPYDNIQMAPREKRPQPLLQRILPTPIFDLLTFGRSAGTALDTNRIAVKCDLCVGHANGPACVRSCPTGAAQRVSPLEFFGE
jgi:Fe-S-cluster-containing hydrogenase component 2